MSAYIFDIDGVVFYKGTNKPNKGAIESIKYLISQGNTVIFITKRNQINYDNPKLNLKQTKDTFKEIGLGQIKIIDNIPSPRYLINDEGAHAINLQTNAQMKLFQKDILKKNNIEKKLYNALATILWVTVKYDDCLDADEYVQTLLIAQSLISNEGFNHSDLVKRYRSKTNHIFKNKALHGFHSGGVSKHYRGQIYRLIKSNNPLYLAKTGVTDGAAMKVLPIVAYYLFDFESLVLHVDKIIKITHYAVEARLSAVLITLRYRQILLGTNHKTDDLLNELKRAIKILKFDKKSNFFLEQVIKAKKIADEESNPEILLKKLATEIGLDYLAWSTPISACFWSYRATNKYYKYFNPKNDKTIKINNVVIDENTLKKEVIESYTKHLVKIKQYKSHLQAHGYHWKEKIDIDTFFSISFSIVAMRDGIENIDQRSKEAIKEYGENFTWIIKSLLYKGGGKRKISYRQIKRMIFYRFTKILINTLEVIKLNLGIKKAMKRMFLKIRN